MGSGYSGLYSGTLVGSQPYSDTYHVVKEMLDRDKQDPDIYNPETGYFKNPTAINIESAISGNFFKRADGQKISGHFIYILDKNGNIIIGKRSNPNNPKKRAPHPTLIGGKDPQVQCAGIIEFRRGRIYKFNNASGHYQPNYASLSKVKKVLKRLYQKNPLLFHKDSPWRKHYGQ